MMSSIIQQVLIKDMKPYQVEQWATLLQLQTMENFVTVVAVKGVEFIDDGMEQPMMEIQSSTVWHLTTPSLL